MPDLSAALDRRLLDSNGVMKEPVSGEALHISDAVKRNLIIDVIVSVEGVARVTRVNETFRLRVDMVLDTSTNQWLPLDSAVDAGIVIAADGEYFDRRRGIHLPLIDAVRDGLIEGRLLDVERKKYEIAKTSDESSGMQRVDGGFNSVRSSRRTTSAVVGSEDLPVSINVRGIVDPQTGVELPVKEAVNAGIFDAFTGEFIVVESGQRLSLERAVALNLVVLDQDDQEDDMTVQQTYSIGAVCDPVTGELVAPSEAVACGVLDMARGIYIDTVTGEVVTLADALERGLIRAEPLGGDAETLEFETKTVVASSVERDRKVFAIRSVKDLSTGEMISPEEAVRRGILDTVKGIYCDRQTGRMLPMHEAYEAGLIVAAEASSHEPVESPSLRRPFHIVAVIDPRSMQQLSVAEAVERHLLDATLRQFVDLCSDEVMSVEEAVSRGYVIVDYDTSMLRREVAAVVHDTQSYRIKSVIDAQTGEEITISDAVRHKIVDKASGMYWNMKTNELIPIDEAIRLALVVTEPVDTAVTKTAQLSLGDDVEKEIYVLTTVRDQKTGQEFDPVEAERRGLINKLQGVYINPVTGEKIPIREAIERNLISGSVVAEADYDDLPPGAYTTVEMTQQQMKAANVASVWDPVTGRQVCVRALSFSSSANSYRLAHITGRLKLLELTAWHEEAGIE